MIVSVLSTIPLFSSVYHNIHLPKKDHEVGWWVSNTANVWSSKWIMHCWSAIWAPKIPIISSPCKQKTFIVLIQMIFKFCLHILYFIILRFFWECEGIPDSDGKTIRLHPHWHFAGGEEQSIFSYGWQSWDHFFPKNSKPSKLGNRPGPVM